MSLSQPFIERPFAFVPMAAGGAPPSRAVPA